MEILNLTVESRSQNGKGPARRLRSELRVPGVLYGPKIKSPVALSINAREFGKVARNAAGSLIKLNAGGNKDLDGKMALIKSSQKHPVSKDYLHVDFYEVDMDKPLRLKVAVKFTGKCKGVAEGGILEIIRREIEVECLPSNIPQAIEVDVTELDIGDNFHIQDLKMPEGVKATGELNYTVVAISSPDEEEVARPQAAAGETVSAEVPRVGDEDKKEEEASK